MTNQQGFSLIEVLVGLLLITSTSLILLHQQWQLSQILNHVLLSSQTLVQFDNDREMGVISPKELPSFFPSPLIGQEIPRCAREGEGARRAGEGLVVRSSFQIFTQMGLVTHDDKATGC